MICDDRSSVVHSRQRWLFDNFAWHDASPLNYSCEQRTAACAGTQSTGTWRGRTLFTVQCTSKSILLRTTFRQRLTQSSKSVDNKSDKSVHACGAHEIDFLVYVTFHRAGKGDVTVSGTSRRGYLLDVIELSSCFCRYPFSLSLSLPLCDELWLFLR